MTDTAALVALLDSYFAFSPDLFDQILLANIEALAIGLTVGVVISLINRT